MNATNRRDLIGLAAGLLLASQAKSQHEMQGGVKELTRHPLTAPEEGMEAVLVEVTVAPDAASKAHRHPGFVLGYVLDGELKFAINGKEPEIIKAGGTFFEPVGAVHTTGSSANPNAPVRFLAFIVAPKGSPLVLPA